MTPAPFNKIFAKKIVDTVVKDGKSIVISAATETTHWRRLDSVAASAGDAVKTAVISSSEPLPAGTVEVCARYYCPQSTIAARPILMRLLERARIGVLPTQLTT